MGNTKPDIWTFAAAFGHDEDEQQVFCRQCDHAVSGRPSILLWLLSQEAADLVSNWYMVVADPIWWCFLGGVYTTCWPVLGSITVARFTRFGVGLCPPWCSGAERGEATGGKYASFWREVRSCVVRQGGLSVTIAAAVAALQLRTEAASTPLCQ